MDSDYVYTFVDSLKLLNQVFNCQFDENYGSQEVPQIGQVRNQLTLVNRIQADLIARVELQKDLLLLEQGIL